MSTTTIEEKISIDKALSSIEGLKIIEGSIKKKISDLQIEESNLKNCIREEQFRLEAQKKLDELTLTKKENVSNVTLDIKETRISQRERAVELSEERLRDRIITVEKREKNLLYIEDKIHQLNKERVDFESMRRNLMVDIDKLKEEKAMWEGKEKELEVREDNIRGREKAIQKQEKYYQDCLGEIAVQKKEVQKMIDHLEGLKKEANYAS